MYIMFSCCHNSSKQTCHAATTSCSTSVRSVVVTVDEAVDEAVNVNDTVRLLRKSVWRAASVLCTWQGTFQLANHHVHISTCTPLFIYVCFLNPAYLPVAPAFISAGAPTQLHLNYILWSRGVLPIEATGSSV